MEIHLKYGNTDLQLPVIPKELEVTGQQNNQKVNILSKGEINLLGKQGLRTLPIESFFPAQGYKGRGWVAVEEPKEPSYYVKVLQKWKDSDAVIKLIVTETVVQWNVTIEDFKYKYDEVDGSISYTLDLCEYRKVSTKRTTNGKVKFPAKHTIKKGETLKKIAKKYYGSSSYASYIYKCNKKTIEKAWDKYRKAYNKKVKAYNKKHTKKKKYITQKQSGRGKRLVPGTKLTLKKPSTTDSVLAAVSDPFADATTSGVSVKL